MTLRGPGYRIQVTMAAEMELAWNAGSASAEQDGGEGTDSGGSRNDEDFEHTPTL